MPTNCPPRDDTSQHEADGASAKTQLRAHGDELGGRFFEATVGALDAIGHMPGAGSPRFGEPSGIPWLRYRSVTGFPCGWFYFLADEHIDVVRLLADAQDLPTILADTERE